MTSETADPRTASAEREREGAAETKAGATAAAAPQPVRRRQPPRTLVRTVGCPTCGAFAGEPCQGRRGPRVSHHLARVELAVELRFGQRLELPRTSSRNDGSGATVKARSADPDAGGVDSGEADVTMREVLGGYAR